MKACVSRDQIRLRWENIYFCNILPSGSNGCRRCRWRFFGTAFGYGNLLKELPQTPRSLMRPPIFPVHARCAMYWDLGASFVCCYCICIRHLAIIIITLYYYFIVNLTFFVKNAKKKTFNTLLSNTQITIKTSLHKISLKSSKRIFLNREQTGTVATRTVSE